MSPLKYEPRRLQRSAPGPVPTQAAITNQQQQIYPKPKKEPHQMQPSQQSKYQQRRHFLAQRHPGEPNLEDVVPGRGAYISSRAQFRSEARMFEHGMIYRGLPQASGHQQASGCELACHPSRSGRRLVCVFGVCLRAPSWRGRCLRLRGVGAVLRR